MQLIIALIVYNRINSRIVTPGIMYDLHIDFFIQFTWDFVKIRCFAGIYRFIYSRVHNNTCFQHSIYLNFNHYKCTLLSNCPSNKSINIVKQGTVLCITRFGPRHRHQRLFERCEGPFFCSVEFTLQNTIYLLK